MPLHVSSQERAQVDRRPLERILVLINLILQVVNRVVPSGQVVLFLIFLAQEVCQVVIIVLRKLLLDSLLHPINFCGCLCRLDSAEVWLVLLVKERSRRFLVGALQAQVSSGGSFSRLA